MRTVAIDDVGNLSAPPGSRPWSVAMRLEIQSVLRDERSSAEHMGTLLRLFVQHNGFRELEDDKGKRFPTFESFCLCKPPWGLGYSRDDIDRIIKERASAERRAEQAKPTAPSGRPKKGESPTPLPKGMHSDRLAARIARDRPDILERMKAGEYRSVRAAAKDAGIVKEKIQVPKEPEGAARLLLKHFGAKQIKELIRLLSEGLK
jgi:hypothetical protein